MSIDEELSKLREDSLKLVTTERTLGETRKLYAEMVSEFRHQAKTAEDLANQLYRFASHFEGKLREIK